MKKQIINYVVLIAIAIAANYPIYNNLQESVKVAQATISNVNSMVSGFNNELDSLENNILDIYIRADITKAQLIAELDSTLNKINKIKFDTQIINQRLNKMVDDKVEKELDKIQKNKLEKIINKQPIPGLPGF
tara:strand:- start:3863 stop:4261 length:399 start_codon:yes stop_codon:yes gene_type:complete